MADGFEDDVRAVAAGQFADPGDAFLAARRDDAGGAEGPAQVGARGVTLHQEICCAPRRLAASTAIRPTAPSPITVTRVRALTPPDTAAWWPGAEHVGEGEQGRDERAVGGDGKLDQGSSANGTRIASAWPPSSGSMSQSALRTQALYRRS